MGKKSVGEFLAILRREHGYTQQEVADKLCISNRTISAWERDISAPDILLLSTLSDLYGVTVDEILHGERKVSEEKSLEGSSAMLSGRLTRFGLQVKFLTGILGVGLILFFIGYFSACISLRIEWWKILLLCLGLSFAILCGVILFFLWRKAETAGRKQVDFGTYCILLRKKISGALYFIAALTFSLGIFAVLVWYTVIPVAIIFLLLSALAYGLGFFLHRGAVVKWGGEEGASSSKRNAKFAGKISLFGLIPFACAVIFIALTATATVSSNSFDIYRESDRALFISHMETFVDEYEIYDALPEGEICVIEPYKEYDLALTERSKTAAVGEVIELGRGFSCVFNEDKSLCVVTAVYRVDGATDEPTHKKTYRAERITTEDGTFSVYNLRYAEDPFRYQTPIFSDASGITEHMEKLVADKNGYAFIAEFYGNNSSIGRIYGTVVIGLDVLVCILLFHRKKEKFRVKL